MTDHLVNCKGPIAVGDRIVLSVTGTAPPTEPPIEPPIEPPTGNYDLIELPWSNNHREVAIPANGTIAIKTVTGNKPSPQNNPPNLTVSNWSDGNFYRVACLSYTPNDFEHPIDAMFGNNWPNPVVGAIQAIFSVVTAQMGYAVVPTNRAIYLNVRDKSGVDSQVRITLATKE